MWFERIKRFYDRDLWSIEWVKEAVENNKITEEEYKKITGKEY